MREARGRGSFPITGRHHRHGRRGAIVKNAGASLSYDGNVAYQPNVTMSPIWVIFQIPPPRHTTGWQLRGTQCGITAASDWLVLGP